MLYNYFVKCGDQMPVEEHTYLCQNCHNLFKLELDLSSVNQNDLTCPKCGSTQINNLPSWSPTGSNLDVCKLEWEYQCQDCNNIFKLPIPTSPEQEKEIICPECNGGHIHRLTPTGGEPLYCG